MTFIWPALLLSIALVPLGILVARRIDGRRHGRVEQLTGTVPASAATRTRARDRIPGALVIAALVVFGVALARPQATIAVPRLEGTLMLTFDVSASMGATDVEPTRMEAAKAAAREIVEARPPGVVVGVVAFSNAGMAVQAPTSDMSAVLAAIGRLTPTEGTSLGSGIVSTLEAIAAAQADTPADYYSSRSPQPTETPQGVEPGSRPATVVVLFSDGENTEDSDPDAAARIAASQGIRIITVGVGSPEGATLDLDGFQVQTRLDEATLQRIADTSAGTYAAVADARPALAYDQLARALVSRTEDLELTALVAALGLVLLLAGVSVSLARSGRLP